MGKVEGGDDLVGAEDEGGGGASNGIDVGGGLEVDALSGGGIGGDKDGLAALVEVGQQPAGDVIGLVGA